MASDDDWLLQQSLEILRVLVARYPLPDYDHACLALPENIHEAWKLAKQEQDVPKCMQYGMIPHAVYACCAGALNAGHELIAVLGCGHVIAAAALTRKVFESMVMTTFILADDQNLVENARRVYYLDLESRAWFLQKTLLHKTSSWAPVIIKNCRDVAERDYDGFCRMHWNKCFDDSQHTAFFRQLRFEHFPDEIASNVAGPDEIAGVKPWTREYKIRKMCETIDRSPKNTLDLRCLEEYDLQYSGLSQLVHGEPGGAECFTEEGDGQFHIGPACLDSQVLHTLAYKGSEYLAHTLRAVHDFTHTSSTSLAEALRRLEEIKTQLPSLLKWPDLPAA